MAAHENLDDDLLQPPPSAQRASSPAQVRVAGSRPIARHRHDANAATSSPSAFGTWHKRTNPTVDSTPGTPVRHERILDTMSFSTHDLRRSNALGQPALAAPPARFFDAWNSSSTGHQRAENRLSGSTSWRQSRNVKLGEQYRGGLTGGKRVANTCGVGSELFGEDARKANGTWENGAKGLRQGSQSSLVELWSGMGSTQEGKRAVVTTKEVDPPRTSNNDTPSPGAEQEAVSEVYAGAPSQSAKSPTPIFEGLCFYLNGSTAPLVSDHCLKHLISLHGGTHSISLTRRTVTHCILGKSCGGGLSASKMHREMMAMKKKGVRFVTADWILSSVKVNRRLPETPFSALLLPTTQTSMTEQISKAGHG